MSDAGERYKALSDAMNLLDKALSGLSLLPEDSIPVNQWAKVMAAWRALIVASNGVILAAAPSPTPSPVEERLRKALEQIAHHDGDRWDWGAPLDYDAHSLLRRKPSPQEIAREALSPTTAELPDSHPVDERLRAAAYLNGLERDELRDRVKAAKALCRRVPPSALSPFIDRILAALSPTTAETEGTK